MAVSSAFVLHGVQTASNFYCQLESADPQSNIETFQVIPVGHTQPLFVGTSGVRPTLALTTHQCATILGELGILGADLSGGNVDLYYKSVSELGDRVADASLAHLRIRAAETFGYVESIRAQHNQLATVSAQLVFPYDGVNAPLVPAGSLALSGTPTGAENYTLGPVSINSTELDGVDDMTINLNPQLFQLGSAGEIYDTFVALKTITPEIVLTSYTTTAWATYGLDGTALSAFSGYLRKREADGENVADVTAEHVKFTAATGKITVQSVRASGSDPAMVQIRIPLRAANASGNALTIDTASAIT